MSNVTSNITLKGYFIFYFKGFKKKIKSDWVLTGEGMERGHLRKISRERKHEWKIVGANEKKIM